MKAARIIPGPEGGTLRVMDVPTPAAGAGQVLVRVRASGLNRGEIKMVRNARGKDAITAGVEFAGEIAAVGAGVTGWREGDRVAGHGSGGQAEYVLAAPQALMAVPATLPWTEAAAFPNVFITAHDALITNGNLRPGETVLVNAATSGIGLAALQIAQVLGARSVIATTRSSAKARRLREFGIAQVIDLSEQDMVQAVNDLTGQRGVDIVIDSVGGTVFADNLKSLAIGGRLVNIGRLGSSSASIDLETLWLKRLQLIGVTFRTRSEAERLACVQACADDLLRALFAGRLRFPVDRVYPLSQIEEAHRYMETDQHFGKIVLAVDESLARAV